MTNPPEHIDELMARLATGDRAALTPAFHRLWPPVRRLCGGMLKNPADADDAAQIAMEKILSRSAEYDVTRPAMPWALGIAGWECRSIRRKHQRSREIAPLNSEVASTDSLEDAIVARDLLKSTLAAIDELSPADRETLLALVTSEETSASGATLRKRRERALARLRSAMRRFYAFD